MVKKDVVYAKIETLRHCLKRISDKTPCSGFELLEDYDLQDIISVNLERAVQCSVDIAAHIISCSDKPAPDSMGQTFRTLHELGVIDQKVSDKLVASVGFRNIAVHSYKDIDWDIVFAIITKEIDVFKELSRLVLEFVDKRSLQQ